MGKTFKDITNTKAKKNGCVEPGFCRRVSMTRKNAANHQKSDGRVRSFWCLKEVPTRVVREEMAYRDQIDEN